MKNLKILSTTLLIILLAFTQGFAQKELPTVEEIEYGKGQFEIQAGIGLLPTFTSTMVSSDVKARFLPVNVVLNYRVNKAFNLGAYFGYSSTEYNKQGNIKDEPPTDLYQRNDFYLVGLRAEGHFNRERVDFYGGAMFGYNFSNIETNIEDPKDRPEGIEVGESDLFTYSGYVGMKYALTPKFGIYGEIGYGVSLISLGGSYRF